MKMALGTTWIFLGITFLTSSCVKSTNWEQIQAQCLFQRKLRYVRKHENNWIIFFKIFQPKFHQWTIIKHWKPFFRITSKPSWIAIAKPYFKSCMKTTSNLIGKISLTLSPRSNLDSCLKDHISLPKVPQILQMEQSFSPHPQRWPSTSCTW